MFDLITGTTDHIPSRPAVPVLVSLTAQIGLVAAVAAVSVFVGSRALPEAPSMMAFVAELPAALPPPPPPAPASTRQKAASTTESAIAPTVAQPTLTEAPASIEPTAAGEGEDVTEGAPGGVEGGIPGGVVGGVVTEPPSQPPPPPVTPPAPAPVRVGGKVPQPALVHRVEPIYPRAAVEARTQGIVILETVVGADGRVLEVRVLRSAGDVLDREAVAAIRQWRYAPLEINGVPVRFLLTATLSFKLD